MLCVSESGCCTVVHAKSGARASARFTNNPRRNNTASILVVERALHICRIKNADDSNIFVQSNALRMYVVECTRGFSHPPPAHQMVCRSSVRDIECCT